MRHLRTSVTAVCATVLSAAVLVPATASAAPAPAPGAGAGTFTTGVVWADGFEEPVVPAPQPFTGHPAGGTVGAWTVGTGSVDLVSDRLWDAAEGRQSVDLSGNGPGSISRTVPTHPLTTYVVTYRLAGNSGRPPAVKTGELRVDGAVVDDLTFDTTGRTPRAMGWEQRTVYFTTLLRTSATLTFSSTTESNGGPVVDDVTVRSCLLVLCPYTTAAVP